MDDNLGARPIDFRKLTVGIVAAYVSNNHVQAAELPNLILDVYAAVQEAAHGGLSAAASSPVEKPSAAEIKRSISRDALISFEDGGRYKTLKRHLSGRGLTPENYREKWGLPKDYPMVAPGYAEQRSALAKAIGLGRPRQSVGRGAASTEGRTRGEPKRRGRKKVA